MNLYMIRRRNNWTTPEALEASAKRSAKVGNEEMPDRVRWIRSYVVEEEDGGLGTLCIYQGTDEASSSGTIRRAGRTPGPTPPPAARPRDDWRPHDPALPPEGGRAGFAPVGDSAAPASSLNRRTRSSARDSGSCDEMSRTVSQPTRRTRVMSPVKGAISYH